MTLVSRSDVDTPTPGSTGAKEGICGSIEAPHITEPSVDTLYTLRHTLRPPQRLAGRGLVLRSVPDSARGGERHCEGSCHARQRVK